MLLFSFSQKNDVTKTVVVLTDKDCKELFAVHTIFTNAESLLCIFHVFQAVDRRLDKAGLQHDHRLEVYNKLRDAVYCKDQRQLEDAASELCVIGMK